MGILLGVFGFQEGERVRRNRNDETLDGFEAID